MWFTAWAVKKQKITGWDGYQSNLVVVPTVGGKDITGKGV